VGKLGPQAHAVVHVEKKCVAQKNCLLTAQHTAIQNMQQLRANAHNTARTQLHSTASCC